MEKNIHIAAMFIRRILFSSVAQTIEDKAAQHACTVHRRVKNRRCLAQGFKRLLYDIFTKRIETSEGIISPLKQHRYYAVACKVVIAYDSVYMSAI